MWSGGRSITAPFQLSGMATLFPIITRLKTPNEIARDRDSNR